MHNEGATYDIHTWIGSVSPYLDQSMNAGQRVLQQQSDLMTPSMDIAQPFFTHAPLKAADSFTRQSASPTSSTSSPPSRKAVPKSSESRRTPHSMVGRRYRDHLNRQIERLRVAIPEVSEGGNGNTEEQNDSSGRWPSKPLIIGAAVKYIETLQHEKTQDQLRIQMLQEQLVAMQNMLQCGDYPVVPYIQYHGEQQPML